MNLLAWPRGTSRAAFFGDGRLRSRELSGKRWELRIQGKRARILRIRASLLSLRQRLRPCAVKVDGDPLPRPRWAYRAKRGVLSARLRAKRARVVVRGHC
jgi:hypothetical protein